MKTLDIPNIASIKAATKTNLSAAEQWKEYFLKQETIKTIIEKGDIKAILDGTSISEPVPTVAFIVLFPRSFRHLHDFLSGLQSSSGMAVFLINGNVILSINEEFSPMSYVDAWQQIINRTTGTEFLSLISPKPTSNIEAIEKLKADHDTFQQRLQAWVDAFNQIPGVKAEIYDEVPGRLIEVRLVTGPPTSSFDNIEDWELNEGNSAEVNGYSDGEMCNTYEQWRDEVTDVKNLTWQEFYNRVVILSQRYAAIPKLQTENA